MYNTKKLWTPLSTVLRRALPRTCRSTSLAFNSRIRSLSAHLDTSLRVPPHYGHDFLPNLKFTAKSFGSQSASKFDASIKRCWNCDAVKPGTALFLYCDLCRSIQPVDSSNDYFQIFGL